MKILSESSDGSIEVLEPHAFGLEIHLQELLELHPELVLADLPADEDRSIWTIGWEVYTSAGSIDLLMLDSTGRVWVVETKLASNSEVKKQVVGQVLGYASAVATWDEERLVAVGTEYLVQRGGTSHLDLIDFLADQIGSEDEAKALIGQAAARLATGDITSLIVVDEAPQELRRLVEFVNYNASFELLALKIELLPNRENRLFIPRIFGAVASTGGTDAASQRQQWDRDRFLHDLTQHDAASVPIAVVLLDWSESQPLFTDSWGTGAQIGSYIPFVSFGDGDWIPLFALYSNGRISPTWRYREVHRDEAYWLPMVEALDGIGGVQQRIDGARGIPLSAFAEPTIMERFKQAVLEVAASALEK